MIAGLFLALAALLAAAGAVWDIATRRLPNFLVLALTLAAAVAAYAGGGFALLGSGALHAAIVIAIGMALFALGAAGAGDAKFYAACALAVPLPSAMMMLSWLAVAALILFVAMLVANRGLARRTAHDGQPRASWTLPYGLPIAIGFIMAARPWDALA